MKPEEQPPHKRIAVIGSRGRLGAALMRAWGERYKMTGFARPAFDLLHPESIDECLARGDFDWVINCAANTNVDECEKNPEAAFAANDKAPRHIARNCRELGARLLHVSTDYVFDGKKSEPYSENDAVVPISIYGKSKAAGDTAVLEEAPDSIIVRVSWVFGPEKPSFIDGILNKARTDPTASAVADKWSSPTYTEDMADWLTALIEQSAPAGYYHLCNTGGCTWRDYGEYALQCAQAAGISLQTTTVAPISLKDIPAFVAQRPINTVLDTAKFSRTTGMIPRSWQRAVESYIASIAAREAA
jgi:dTDP-4-dehydrorhamnose reductase